MEIGKGDIEKKKKGKERHTLNFINVTCYFLITFPIVVVKSFSLFCAFHFRRKLFGKEMKLFPSPYHDPLHPRPSPTHIHIGTVIVMNRVVSFFLSYLSSCKVSSLNPPFFFFFFHPERQKGTEWT